MSNINWKQFWVVAIIALVIGAVSGIYTFPKEIEADCSDVNQTDCPDVNQTDCPEYEECLTEEEKLIVSGYVMDGFFLENPLYETLSDRELNLFDGEVEFDGKDYDAEEVFYLEGLELLANTNDFEGVPYLTIQEKVISYEFNFEPSLNVSKIGEDAETLTFNLLGKEVEVSKWDNDEMTFTQGEEYFITEGKDITVNGKVITLLYVLEDSVYVDVDGLSSKISEGKTKFINGIEIKASEVLYTSSSTRESKATLIIGEKVKVIISDGDEYSKDSIWEWKITENSIGLVLIEDFTELDEEFSALALGEFICLPNDYVCVYYNGLLNEDSEEYTFDIRDSFVRVKGNFLSDINDYDRIYINENGIYEKDGSAFVLINNETIELGDTESVLNISTGNITIENFVVNFNLSVTSVGTGDEDYLTVYGILVENPEDSVVDKEFKVMVPEEQLEGSITVRQGRFEETIEEQDTEEETPEE